MFKETRFVYLAHGQDFARDPDRAREARKLLRDAGLGVYDPGAAFEIPTSAAVGPVINQVNHAALDACGGLMALLPQGVSIGVPMEIERARGQGKPVLVVADLATVERSWSLQSVSLSDPDYRIVTPNDLRGRDATWLGIRLEQARNPRKPATEPMFFVAQEGARLPKRSYEGDAGFDLFVHGNHTVEPGQVADIPAGVSMQLPEGYWAQITGRSSAPRKLGLQVHTGTIDQGYRGPLYALVENLNDRPVELADGQRVAQLIPFPLTSARLHPIRVDVLAESDRGTAGFGSSGA